MQPQRRPDLRVHSNPYDSQFQTILADTDVARRAHYQLRYQVFCLETGFEDPDRYPDREERDRYDDHAIHFLTRQNDLGHWVAAMRLVPARHGTLPIGGLCRFNPEATALLRHPCVAEVSRLSIVTPHRRRLQDNDTLCDSGGGHPHPRVVRFERRTEPFLLLGMLRAALTFARLNAIEKLFFLIRPALARVLTRQGIPFSQVGPAVEHRGLRYPYIADVEAGWRALSDHRTPEVGRMFQAPHAYHAHSEMDEIPGSDRMRLVNAATA